MDTRTRQLFMACGTNLVVVNANGGAVVARTHVASRADQNCFDPVTRLVFDPNRVDSTMTVVHESAANRYTVVETVRTGGGARTCAVDEPTHKVYVFYYEGTSRETAQLVLAVLRPRTQRRAPESLHESVIFPPRGTRLASRSPRVHATRARCCNVRCELHADRQSWPCSRWSATARAGRHALIARRGRSARRWRQGRRV